VEKGEPMGDALLLEVVDIDAREKGRLWIIFSSTLSISVIFSIRLASFLCCFQRRSFSFVSACPLSTFSPSGPISSCTGSLVTSAMSLPLLLAVVSVCLFAVAAGLLAASYAHACTPLLIFTGVGGQTQC